MKLANLLAGYDLEKEHAGNPCYEGWKLGLKVTLGGMAITGVGLVLEAVGIPTASIGHDIEIGGTVVMVAGIAKAAISTWGWSDNEQSDSLPKQDG
jgi:hypothetical protein